MTSRKKRQLSVAVAKMLLVFPTRQIPAMKMTASRMTTKKLALSEPRHDHRRLSSLAHQSDMEAGPIPSARQLPKHGVARPRLAISKQMANLSLARAPPVSRPSFRNHLVSALRDRQAFVLRTKSHGLAARQTTRPVGIVVVEDFSTYSLELQFSCVWFWHSACGRSSS